MRYNYMIKWKIVQKSNVINIFKYLPTIASKKKFNIIYFVSAVLIDLKVKLSYGSFITEIINRIKSIIKQTKP